MNSESKPLQSIVDRQRAFFDSDATKALPFRMEQLRSLRNMITDNEALFNEAIHKDIKKSPFETYATEIGLLLAEIKTTLRNLRRWAKPKKVRTNLANFPASSYIIPEPLGVSLVIGAWNYPYLLSLSPAITAMAAGCTIVLKPSELSPNTSALLAKLVAQTFSPDYFTVIKGDAKTATDLLDCQWDKIFFTGSSRVGRIVYQAAARHLTPVTLELGGKSPAFVTESCDMDKCIRRLVWAKFINAGQTCIAPDYVLVHRSVEEEFLQKTKAEIEKADYRFANGNYIQIVNEQHMRRLISLIDENKLYSGGHHNIDERYLEPTLLKNVTFEDKVMEDEIFGPILPVIVYDDIEQAVLQVKKRPRPLACYVFTNENPVREHILKTLSFGGGCINEALMHISNLRLPFGGVGNSGIGSYHHEAGFRAFTHYKSILDKPTWLESDVKYPPYSPKKLKMMKKLFG